MLEVRGMGDELQKATHRGGLVRSREVEILRDTALKPTHTHTHSRKMSKHLNVGKTSVSP